MTDKQIAVKVDHVSKYFKLPTEATNSLRTALVNRFKGIKGYKEQHVLKDISFEVKRGEILGLGGLVGAGRTELAQLIFGSEPITSGEIIYKGRPLRVKNCQQAIGHGISMIPEDRKRHGVILDMSIKENTTMPCLKKISPKNVIQPKKETEVTESYRKSLLIKAPTIEQLVKNLSGGNQQK